MNSPTPALTSRRPSASQWAALLNLLADDDATVYQTVRKEILSLGPEAGDWLRPHLLSGDPTMRRPARDILRPLDKQEADTRFLSFCLKHGEEFDLEKASWLFARTEYPEINIDGYQALLDNYATDLRECVDFEDPAEKILATINQYFFTELRFAGNEANYYDPENSYLNRVIDRRTGNPISLCLLYILLARRLRLPVAGIGLPGHFVCRYQSTAAEVYIDPFNGGKFLTKADCIQYLVHGNYSLRDENLAPVRPRRMLHRICNNLHQIYLH